jgi:protein involved in plasmid replication-relaxation
MREYGLAGQADAYVEYLMLLHFDTLHTLFLEVDTGSERSRVIRDKIAAYAAYARSGAHEKLFAAPAFRVLFVATTSERVRALRRLIEQTDAPDIFWLADWKTFSHAALLDPYWVRPHRQETYPLSSP